MPSRRRPRRCPSRRPSREQQRQFVSFITKARGWLIVAGGAFFIAVKETWELHEVYEWPTLTFWLLLVAAAILALAGTLIQTTRADHAAADKHAGREEDRG